MRKIEKNKESIEKKKERNKKKEGKEETGRDTRRKRREKGAFDEHPSDVEKKKKEGKGKMGKLEREKETCDEGTSEPLHDPRDRKRDRIDYKGRWWRNNYVVSLFAIGWSRSPSAPPR